MLGIFNLKTLFIKSGSLKGINSSKEPPPLANMIKSGFKKSFES